MYLHRRFVGRANVYIKMYLKTLENGTIRYCIMVGYLILFNTNKARLVILKWNNGRREHFVIYLYYQKKNSMDFYASA